MKGWKLLDILKEKLNPFLVVLFLEESSLLFLAFVLAVTLASENIAGNGNYLVEKHRD